MKNLNETNAYSNSTDAADVASDLIGEDVQAALGVDLHGSLQGDEDDEVNDEDV